MVSKGIVAVLSTCTAWLITGQAMAQPPALPPVPGAAASADPDLQDTVPAPGSGDTGETAPPAPSHGYSEARAMWVVRYSLLSPPQVHRVVEYAVRGHFNALMVQVRGRGDAYYHSNLEPRAEGLADQPESFDPLAQMVQEAHAHHIRVFAWVVVNLVWNGRRSPQSPLHVVNRHPEWIDQRYDGSAMSGTDYEGQFLNPGIPAARKYSVDVCRDLVRHYDVDGVQLDYIRYPAPELGYNWQCLAGFYSAVHDGARCSDGATLRAFARSHPDLWTEWKQQQVTEQVREIRQGIHAEKPWVSLSAAVWSDLDDARDNRMQDWPTWLREGLVDFVCPMAYSTNTNRVVRQIAEAVRLSHGRQIWAGIGAWQMTASQTAAKIEAVREVGAAGICLFSYDGMTDGGERGEYLDALSRGPLARLAAFPAMPWLPSHELIAGAPGNGDGG